MHRFNKTPRIPAPLVLGTALGLLGAGCGPPEAAEPAAPEPAAEESGEEEEAAAPAGPPLGDYTCHIELAGEAEPAVACEVVEDDLGEGLWLETLGGDVWLSGVVEPREDEAFVLEGDVFCAQGACDDVVDAVFSEVAEGVYEAEAEISAGALAIRIQR